MTRDEFIRDFAEILSVSPESLTPEAEMDSFENWDSLAYLSAIVLMDDKLAIKMRPETLEEVKTFSDILRAVESALK